MDAGRDNPTTADVRDSYPNINSADTPVWSAWLAAHQDQAIQVYYNVALGGVDLAGQDIPQEMIDGWKYTTAVKVDTIVITENETLCCEVKPVARLGALGQALGYALLLANDPLNDLPIVPVVIAGSASAEVQYVANALGVRIELVMQNG